MITVKKWSDESVELTYKSTGIMHSTHFAGPFATRKEALLAGIEHLAKVGIISMGQSMAYRRHVISPPTRDHMKKMRATQLGKSYPQS